MLRIQAQPPVPSGARSAVREARGVIGKGQQPAPVRHHVEDGAESGALVEHASKTPILQAGDAHNSLNFGPGQQNGLTQGKRERHTSSSQTKLTTYNMRKRLCESNATVNAPAVAAMRRYPGDLRPGEESGTSGSVRRCIIQVNMPPNLHGASSFPPLTDEVGNVQVDIPMPPEEACALPLAFRSNDARLLRLGHAAHWGRRAGSSACPHPRRTRRNGFRRHNAIPCGDA